MRQEMGETIVCKTLQTLSQDTWYVSFPSQATLTGNSKACAAAFTRRVWHTASKSIPGLHLDRLPFSLAFSNFGVCNPVDKGCALFTAPPCWFGPQRCTNNNSCEAFESNLGGCLTFNSAVPSPLPSSSTGITVQGSREEDAKSDRFREALPKTVVLSGAEADACRTW